MYSEDCHRSCTYDAAPVQHPSDSVVPTRSGLTSAFRCHRSCRVALQAAVPHQFQLAGDGSMHAQQCVHCPTGHSCVKPVKLAIVCCVAVCAPHLQVSSACIPCQCKRRTGMHVAWSCTHIQPCHATRAKTQCPLILPPARCWRAGSPFRCMSYLAASAPDSCVVPSTVPSA